MYTVESNGNVLLQTNSKREAVDYALTCIRSDKENVLVWDEQHEQYVRLPRVIR